ncbi:MAG: anti-sigma factor antagonist [Austwickia sp.]|jgi:anti-sigma B factor antagonist|nr:anti-sigma factor antagonist [Austwickia sp.]MBK8437802.1 anti-sigma factor antagonist [Austwickia sp.]MBK9100109.1 anti-sigma factor antagonist [Austwickia sp.]
MDVTVSNQEHPEVVLVTIGGDVDVYTAPALREQLDRLIAAGRRHMVLDLEQVPFMDSTALGVLVGRLKLTRVQHGSLRVVCTVPRILRVFDITGLKQVLPVHDTVDDALTHALAQVAETTAGTGGTPGG